MDGNLTPYLSRNKAFPPQWYYGQHIDSVSAPSQPETPRYDASNVLPIRYTQSPIVAPPQCDHAPYQALAASVTTLNDRVNAITKKKPLTTKKVLLGLGLAFLSASTVRYWYNKLEPLVDAYVSSHVSVTQVQTGGK